MIRNRRTLAWLLIALGVATFGTASGCSSDDGKSGGVSEDNLVAELARAYCEAGAVCCAAGRLAANENCLSEYRQVLEARVQQLQRDGKTEYDGEAASECLTLLKFKQCGFDIDGTILTSEYYSSSCTGIYHRPTVLKPNELCQEDAECIPPANGSASCEEVEYVAQRCVQRVVVPAGQPCGKTNLPGVEHVCGEEAWCDRTIPQCVPYPGEGESCDDTFDCRTGLRCDYDSRVCVVAEGSLSVGQPCSSDYECRSYHCDQAGVCGEVRLKDEGEQCEESALCLSGTCDYDDLAKRTVCGPLNPYQAGMVNATTCDTR